MVTARFLGPWRPVRPFSVEIACMRAEFSSKTLEKFRKFMQKNIHILQQFGIRWITKVGWMVLVVVSHTLLLSVVTHLRVMFWDHENLLWYWIYKCLQISAEMSFSCEQARILYSYRLHRPKRRDLRWVAPLHAELNFFMASKKFKQWQGFL